MSPEWALLAGTTVAGVAAGTAWKGLHGGALRHEQKCRFVCPRFERGVVCRIVQDIRTGQWKGVESCTAFDDPIRVLCAQDCARLMNLGFRLPSDVRA